MQNQQDIEIPNTLAKTTIRTANHPEHPHSTRALITHNDMAANATNLTGVAPIPSVAPTNDLSGYPYYWIIILASFVLILLLYSLCSLKRDLLGYTYAQRKCDGRFVKPDTMNYVMYDLERQQASGPPTVVPKKQGSYHRYREEDSRHTIRPVPGSWNDSQLDLGSRGESMKKPHLVKQTTWASQGDIGVEAASEQSPDTTFSQTSSLPSNFSWTHIFRTSPHPIIIENRGSSSHRSNYQSPTVESGESNHEGHHGNPRITMSTFAVWNRIHGF